MCYLLDVIDECVKEMELKEETHFETMKISMPLIFEDDDWCSKFRDDGLRECLALTPNHMPCPKKPNLELKVLPKTLRYKFLDSELK